MKLGLIIIFVLLATVAVLMAVKEDNASYKKCIERGGVVEFAYFHHIWINNQLHLIPIYQCKEKK